MSKIRKGDDIIVIAGKDKGKHSTVTKMVGTDRVLVQGINKVKKHEKPNPSKGSSGGIVEIEKSIHISNIAIYNFSQKKADRIGCKFEDNQKIRVFKSSGEDIDTK